MERNCLLLPDSSDIRYTADTALERDPSGWTTYTVVDPSRSLATVITVVGDHITATITKTCLFYATTPASQVLLRPSR